jgi:hypothetical protein
VEARIRSPGGRRSSRRLRIRGGSGVFFHGRAKFIKLAGVFGVFGRDALRNGLYAFKLSRRVKKAALFAAVKFELTFGASTARIKARGENSAAICAPCPGDGSNHARRARAELIGAAGTAGGRVFVPRLIFFFVFFRVAIAAVAILTIHKNLRPHSLADCHNNNLEFGAEAQQFLVLYPKGLLHSAGPNNDSLELMNRITQVREREM